MIALAKEQNIFQGKSSIRYFGKSTKFNALHQVERVMEKRENKGLKTVKPEAFVKFTEFDENGQVIAKEEKSVSLMNEVQKYSKDTYTQGLDEEETPIPIIATFGPIRVKNPKLFVKKYRWCTCGMSLKQVLFY